MAAAPLPAARQITRPLGVGGKCADSTTSGCAAATAASKIARRRGRRSVIGSRRLGQGTRLSIQSAQKKTPAGGPARVDVAPLSGDRISGWLAAGVTGENFAETLPG